MVRLPIILIMMLTATGAAAGAWLRDDGKTFTSVSSSLNRQLSFSTGTFIEHGASPDITIGADISTTRSATALSGSATLFLRRPLGRTDRQSRFAYELGLGAHWDGPLITPHFKGGISWGRGISVRKKNGWVNIDASYRIGLTGKSNPQIKLDSTVGIGLSERFTGMLQLYITYDDDLTSTLSPSAIYAPKHGKFKIQFAAEAPMNNSDEVALKIGIWRDF